MVFSDVIRIGYPHLYVFNCTTVYVRKLSDQANGRGYLLIPSNAYTPATNRLDFDIIICSRVELGEL